MMNDDNKGSGLLKTLFTGVLIGGAAVMLADEKTRTNLKKKLSQLMGDMEELKETGKEKVKTELKKARRNLEKISED